MNDLKEDIRGHCKRNCIYNDNNRCDMWNDFAIPEDVNKCDNYEGLSDEELKEIFEDIEADYWIDYYKSACE